MQDTLLKFILQLSHNPVLITLVALGFFFRDRNGFYFTFSILCFSVVLNYALKVTFKVPLMPHMNSDGYAFPSGHMQAATVFYGWMAILMAKRWINILTIITLIAIGYATVEAKYHLTNEIIAGALVGCLVLVVAKILYTKNTFTVANQLLLLMTFILILYCQIYYGYIPNYIIISCTALMGLWIGSHLLSNINSTINYRISIIGFSIWAISCYSLYSIGTYFTIVKPLKSFLMALQVPLSYYFVHWLSTLRLTKRV